MDLSYERVPYPSAVYPQTHINRLASMATMFGMKPPELHKCRVLEIGCNRGLSLLAMAQQYPGAQFVGIDRSEGSIARATELAEAAGITNVSFRLMDIQYLSGREGECDYLIAHGFYSWVDAAERDKLMEVCGRVLAPNGVAFVSYNVYPGWHLRKMVSDMMKFHTSGVEEPSEKLQGGAIFAASVLRGMGDESPYLSLMKTELQALVMKNAAIVYHDEFAEVNHPAYVSDFIKHAQQHGLQFLTEAEFQATTYENLTQDAQDFLNSTSDVVAREQYLDFFRMARFRHTLLCRQEVALDRTQQGSRFRNMYIGSPVQSTGEVVLTDDSPAKFVAQTGSTITVIQPFVKAVLMELIAAWPGRVHFDELRARAAETSGTSEPEALAMLDRMLTKMYVPGLLEVEVLPWPYPLAVTERPMVTQLARFQAGAGGDVVNMRQAMVELDEPAARVLLRILDGTRTHDELLDSLKLAGHELRPDQLETMLNRINALSLLVG